MPGVSARLVAVFFAFLALLGVHGCDTTTVVDAPLPPDAGGSTQRSRAAQDAGLPDDGLLDAGPSDGGDAAPSKDGGAVDGAPDTAA